MYTDLQSTCWLTSSEFVCELKNKRQRKKRVGQEKKRAAQHRKYPFSDKVAGAESGVEIELMGFRRIYSLMICSVKLRCRYKGHMLLQMDVRDQRSDIPANLICTWNYSWCSFVSPVGEWGCNQTIDTGFIVCMLIAFVIVVFQNSPCLFVQFLSE